MDRTYGPTQIQPNNSAKIDYIFFLLCRERHFSSTLLKKKKEEEMLKIEKNLLKTWSGYHTSSKIQLKCNRHMKPSLTYIVFSILLYTLFASLP